jgi:hypothetical protein
MPLSREDFVRASRGEEIELPPRIFGPPEHRDELWPDHPDLRKAVDWFKTFLPEGEWEVRRKAAFLRLHFSIMGLRANPRGRFFDDADTFAWYLFLSEAFLNHVWNYEPIFGSRVIPVMVAIGRELEALKSVPGIDERVRRIVGSERSQPNGGLFELLVAAAYVRDGATVSFRAERRGVGRTHDIDVTIGGQEYAVECKRMETSAYGERERASMRELWRPANERLAVAGRSFFGSVDFHVPIFDVPDRYLIGRVREWMSSGMPSLLWEDEVARGAIGELDLDPLREVLENNDVLVNSTRLQELLSGRYIRHANYLQVTRHRQGMTPGHMTECDLAILLRWQCLASASVEAKARDVLRLLSSANDQLPTDRPGIVHIGFEAVEGDAVERIRFDKIMASTSAFDPRGKPLRYVFCHYLVPESPPDQAWAFDETVQWRRIDGARGEAPHIPFLVLPPSEGTREGPHWR